MELSNYDVGLEDRPRSRMRLHDCDEAKRAYATHRTCKQGLLSLASKLKYT